MIVKDAFGNPLTAPWGWIQLDMDASNSGLLGEETKEELTARCSKLRAKRLRYTDWLEALELLEDWIESKQA